MNVRDTSSHGDTPISDSCITPELRLRGGGGENKKNGSENMFNTPIFAVFQIIPD